jgi:hypothetical protein
MSYSNVAISIPFARAFSNRVKTLVLCPLTALVLSFMVSPDYSFHLRKRSGHLLRPIFVPAHPLLLLCVALDRPI